MERIKTSLSILLLCLALLSPIGFIPFPNEEGAILIGLAVFWFGFQFVRHSELVISKGLVLIWTFGLYTLLAKPLSYKVPANEYTIFLVFLLALYMLIIYASLDKDVVPKIWENSLIIVALIVSFFELPEILFHYEQFSSTIQQIIILRDLPLPFRLSGFLFVHPNVLAGFLNLVWPILIIRLADAPAKAQKGLWFLALLLLGFIFLYTTSRGGMVGATLGGVFLVFRYLQFRLAAGNRHTSPSQQRLFPLISGIGAIFCVILIGGIILRAIQSGQFSLSGLQADRWITILDSLSSGRGNLWKDSWKAFLEKPLFGHGNAGFTIAYVQAAQLPPGFVATSAHNLWLNVMVEYGLIGLVGLLGFIILLSIKTIQYLSQMKSEPFRHSDAYLASLLAFFGQHLFDSMLWIPNYLASLFIIGILLLRYTLPFGEWRAGRKAYLMIGGLCFLAVVIAYFSMTSRIAPNCLYNQNADISNPKAWTSNICTLANQYPQNALYNFQCSVSLVQQLFSSFSKANPETITQAIEYQKKGLSFDPYWPPQQANLAVLNWLNGDKELAIGQMKQVTNQAPYNVLLWLNYGWMEERAGNQHKALEAFERVVRLSPLVLDSGFKRVSSLFPFTSERLRYWLKSEAQWDSWYKYEIIDEDFHRGVIYLALGEPENALASFNASADRFQPTHPAYYTYLAYALYKNHQIPEASQIAYELALLDQNHLLQIEDSVLFSLIGSILQANDQPDLAYHCFINAYFLQIQPSAAIYYSNIYRQPILESDISPLLIRNLYILEDTRPAWEWFLGEAMIRETPELAQDIAHWYQNINGIAGMTDAE